MNDKWTEYDGKIPTEFPVLVETENEILLIINSPDWYGWVHNYDRLVRAWMSIPKHTPPEHEMPDTLEVYPVTNDDGITSYLVAVGNFAEYLSRAYHEKLMAEREVETCTVTVDENKGGTYGDDMCNACMAFVHRLAKYCPSCGRKIKRGET